MASTDESVRHFARVLAGFMSASDARAFASLAIDPQTFMAAWQAKLRTLSTLAGGYSSPRIEALSAAGKWHAAPILAAPLFQTIYGPAAEIKMVELGKLAVCQWSVLTDASVPVPSVAARADAGAGPDEDQLLQTCLPQSIVPSAKSFWQVIPGRSVVVSATDLTFDVAAGPTVDPSTGQIGLILGSAADLMLVREHNGRYVLSNGYRRALRLRARGVDMAPAVVIRVSSPGDLTPGPGFFHPALLLSPRPPLMDDFLNDAVALEVAVRAMLKVVKISVESLLVPRLV